MSFESKNTIPYISIHAPLAGRDPGINLFSRRAYHFNPRAPCGARLTAPAFARLSFRFQSTRPLRGATYMWGCFGMPVTISIHAPLAGRDMNDGTIATTEIKFQSTRPLRGATANLTNFHRQICANDTKKSNLSRIPPPFGWRDTAFFVRHLLFLGCEPAGRGMIASGSHQMISAPSGA